MSTPSDESFDPASVIGLSEQQASNRLSEEGYNEIPSAKPRSILAIALEVVKEAMFLLLLASGAIYFLLGEVQEGLILLSFVFLVIGITFYQEHKAERALEALRDLSSPRALVIREGQPKRIAGRDVVRAEWRSMENPHRRGCLSRSGALCSISAKPVQLCDATSQ